jgi:oligopeptide/dipeptide ABC transporter ATP-binding protein
MLITRLTHLPKIYPASSLYAGARLGNSADPAGEEREEILLSGEVPSPTNPPPGCRLHHHYPLAFASGFQETPQLRKLSPGHQVACHRY